MLIDVLIFRQTPDEQRGRTVAAVMTMMAIGMPAGLAVCFSRYLRRPRKLERRAGAVEKPHKVAWHCKA